MLSRSWPLVCLFASFCFAGDSRNKCSTDPEHWTPIFNGKDLDGWTHVGPGSMTVENGLLATHGGMGLLYWTGGPIGDCILRVVFRMRDENDNSGVFIRIPYAPRDEWMPVHHGYEVEINNHPERNTPPEDDTHSTGTLYSLTRPLANDAAKPGPEWNTMDITLDGPRTIVTVNGVKVTDYNEGDPVPPQIFDWEPRRGLRPDLGFIGIQNHAVADTVFFKEISTRPLQKSGPQ
jgi:Domain of Unknown Function (DUF1080)